MAGSLFRTAPSAPSSGVAMSSVTTLTTTMSRWIWTWVVRLGTLSVGLVVVLGGILYVKQDSLLYFPEIGGIPRRPAHNPRGYRSPQERQFPFENHSIRCQDGVHIHAWLLLYQKPSSSTTTTTASSSSIPTIIFFHGNAGNIGLRLPNAMQMVQYLQAHVLLVEYRGYGDSDSVPPQERGLKLDGQAALQFCQTHPAIDPKKIFLFGRSLGGAVAFHVAHQAQQQGLPLAGVMVENTFTSIADMVDKLMPFLSWIKPWVLKISWDSAAVVPYLTVPILYLAGQQDQLVPHEHMLRLFGRSTASRYLRIHLIPDGTHNESWMQGGTAYWQAMQRFMTEAWKISRSNSHSRHGTGGDGEAGEVTASLSSSGVPWPSTTSAIPTMSSRFMDICTQDTVTHSGRTSSSSTSSSSTTTYLDKKGH